MFKKYKEITTFDPVTKFRLINSLTVVYNLTLLTPVIMDLKGELLSTWLISMFMILTTLSVKANVYFVHKFSISELFRMGNVLHIFLVLMGFAYYYSPLYFIYIESLLTIIEIAIFSSFSIKLDEYLAHNYPQDIKRFQILRNSGRADFTLSALVVVALVTYYFGIGAAVATFIVTNSLFLVWLFYNWNFFKNNIKIKDTND